MNVDYLLYSRPAKPGPYSLDDLGEMLSPIGPGAVVRANISAVFSCINWRESQQVPGAWFGAGGPVFQLTVEPDGQVMSFMGSCLEHGQMLRLVQAMNLLALDLQRDIVYA